MDNQVVLILLHMIKPACRMLGCLMLLENCDSRKASTVHFNLSSIRDGLSASACSFNAYLKGTDPQATLIRWKNHRDFHLIKLPQV